jgi:hypothetical protein
MFTKINVFNLKKIEFFEDEPSIFNNTQAFIIGRSYEAHFRIINNSAIPRELIVYNDAFKFSDNRDRFRVLQRQEVDFKVVFSPVQEGNENFLLVLKRGGQEQAVNLLSRSLRVVKKSSAKIDVQIKQTLPKYMKLGQKADVIFLLTHKGDEPVNGIHIVIKLEG